MLLKMMSKKHGREKSLRHHKVLSISDEGLRVARALGKSWYANIHQTSPKGSKYLYGAYMGPKVIAW